MRFPFAFMVVTHPFLSSFFSFPLSLFWEAVWRLHGTSPVVADVMPAHENSGWIPASPGMTVDGTAERSRTVVDPRFPGDDRFFPIFSILSPAFCKSLTETPNSFLLLTLLIAAASDGEP